MASSRASRDQHHCAAPELLCVDSASLRDDRARLRLDAIPLGVEAETLRLDWVSLRDDEERLCEDTTRLGVLEEPLSLE